MSLPNPSELAAAAQRIREAQVLGRGGQLVRLFDFLVECAEQARVPKELEIAVDAFGRGSDFDSAQDATVRVYAHKLRRVLDEYYAGPGRADPNWLLLPRGEYRLVLSPAPTPVADVNPPEALAAPDSAVPTEEAVDPAPVRSATRLSRRVWLTGAAAAVGGLGLAAWFSRRRTPAEEEFERVRSSTLWSPLLRDERPIIVATGDYLLLGDTEGGIDVRRLVREFDINNRADLARHERANRYVDLGLSYLPVGVAQAMRDVMPLLAQPHKRIRVLPMSQASADALGLAHVVYLGLLSGLGRLRSAVMAGSGFVMGDTQDELVDTAPGGVRHLAQGSEARGELRDYSYLTAFDTPAGNHVVVIAGTRDIGLMQAGRVVGRAQHLMALEAAVSAPGFEALYRTVATSMDALPVPELLLARPRKSSRDTRDTRAMP